MAFEIGGTDIAGVALEYAAALGFVDRTFHEDLVGDAPSEKLRQFLGGVTLASQADSSTERKVVYPPSVERKLRIISDFHSWIGANKKPRDSIHQGIDIAGRSGQRVIAIADGLVVETHVEKCWGPTVVIDHGIDKDGKPLIALYGHVGKYLVREGQTVSRGDVIARLGNNQRKFKCMFRVRHLHLQLGRIRRLAKGTYWGHAYFLLDAFNAVNPHLLWADGPYRVTCFLITYEGHPARSSQRFTSPGARDGGPTLAERVARRHGRRLDRVSGQCASSNMSFVRNQDMF